MLEQLLGAGIDAFINLTQDDPEVFPPHGSDIHLTRYHGAVDGRVEVLACPIPDMGGYRRGACRAGEGNRTLIISLEG